MTKKDSLEKAKGILTTILRMNKTYSHTQISTPSSIPSLAIALVATNFVSVLKVTIPPFYCGGVTF